MPTHSIWSSDGTVLVIHNLIMDDIYPHYGTDTVQKAIFPTLDFLQDTVSEAIYSPRGNTVAELVLKDVANLPSVVADDVEADDAVGKGIGKHLLTFVDYLRVKGRFPITRSVDGYFAHWSLDMFADVSVTTVAYIGIHLAHQGSVQQVLQQRPQYAVLTARQDFAQAQSGAMQKERFRIWDIRKM